MYNIYIYIYIYMYRHTHTYIYMKNVLPKCRFTAILKDFKALKLSRLFLCFHNFLRHFIERSTFAIY